MEATDASRLVCVVVVSYQEYSLTMGVEGGGAKRVWCATATTLAAALAAALATLCRLAYAAGGGGSGLLG